MLRWMSTADSTTFLKAPESPAPAVTDEIRRRVETMLKDIEAGGAEAMRRWSRELDGWDGADGTGSFLPPKRTSSTRPLSSIRTCAGHIAFAQDQVRRFAQAQRATLTDLRVETQPGVVLGHTQIPVGSVGAYVPGGRYPMLASSFMTIIVANAAGVPRVVAVAPPQREGGLHPAMLYAM